MEAIFIDQKHMALLYKFLVEKSRTDQTLLDLKYRDLSADSIVIGARDNGVLVQAFFIQIDGLHAVTHKIIGSYSNGTVKILDMLCAVCSSRTPEVIYHQFNFLPADSYNFSECYSNSRLGRFTVGRDGQNFTIKYPEI